MANMDEAQFEIDPELKVIWKKHGIPKVFFPKADNMGESRRLHAIGNQRFMQSAFVKETLGDNVAERCEEEDGYIVVRDGTPIKLRIYRPKSARTGLPVMIYSHSGGWCLGSLDTEEFICRLLVTKLNIIIISVAYRLAPEFAFPTGIYDVYDVIKWASMNASGVGGDLSKGFLTGGVSGGGNYTNIATILARDDELEPALTGHLYVCTGMPHQYEGENGNAVDLFPDQLAHGSWETYKHGPVASREVSKFYADLAKCDPYDPLFSPLHLTDFSNLGPVFYQIAGMDIWKDSALFYCNKVEKAGGKVKLELYPGLPHTWWSMYPQLSINKKWAKDLLNGVEWLLKNNEQRNTTSKL